MKAARLHECGTRLLLDEVPTPQPGPGEVLVRIEGSGFCHSDLHVIDGEIRVLPRMPLTLGHENAGTVSAVGAGVSLVREGDPVAVFGGWGCGRCDYCVTGHEQLCETPQWAGLSMHDGGYAEYLLVPHERYLVRLSSLKPQEAALLTDAALTPYRAIKKALPLLDPDHYALLYFRTMAASVLAFLVMIGGTAAQTTESATLNSLQVQELITRGEPSDHARLGVHFAVLAEQYAADARRHNAMARAFIVTQTGRTAANSPADHCRSLERLNLQSAETLRALAAHHAALAEGKASEVPRGAARFERGEGAPAPTAEQLSAMAARASTPADHRGLGEYFETAAKRYTRDANAHTAMAQTYRGTKIAQAAAHCDRLARLARESASEATAAAAMHNGLAGVAR